VGTLLTNKQQIDIEFDAHIYTLKILSSEDQFLKFKSLPDGRLELLETPFALALDGSIVVTAILLWGGMVLLFCSPSTTGMFADLRLDSRISLQNYAVQSDQVNEAARQCISWSSRSASGIETWFNERIEFVAQRARDFAGCGHKEKQHTPFISAMTSRDIPSQQK
jgi:hypothetical protein